MNLCKTSARSLGIVMSSSLIVLVCSQLWAAETTADNPLSTSTEDVPEELAMGGAKSVTSFFITSRGRGTGEVEARLADDDNGDLADGTPTQCLIDEAFGMHGLGPREAGEDSAYFFLTHLRDGIKAPAWDEIVLRADAGPANPDCADGNISHVVLPYSPHGRGTLDSGPSHNLERKGVA